MLATKVLRSTPMGFRGLGRPRSGPGFLRMGRALHTPSATRDSTDEDTPMANGGIMSRPKRASAEDLSAALALARTKVADLLAGRTRALPFPMNLNVHGSLPPGVFEAWADAQPEAQQLEYEPYYAEDNGYLYSSSCWFGCARFVKLPSSHRLAVAELITSALRQSLAERGLGQLVKPPERTPHRFKLGIGLINLADTALWWSRCPDASLLPRGAKVPRLVVEVGMPGETHFDLHQRCDRWLGVPIGYDFCEDKIKGVISIKLDSLNGSNELFVSASLITRQGVQESFLSAGRPGFGDSSGGRSVWQVPLALLVPCAEEDADEDADGNDDDGNDLVGPTLELDVRAALAGLPSLLAQQP